MVCRERSPGTGTGHRRDLSSGRQRSRCCPPGSAPPGKRKEVHCRRALATSRSNSFPRGRATHLTAIPLDGPKTSLQVDQGIQKPLTLSGRFRVESAGEEPVIASGKWIITSQHDGLRVLLTLPSENYVIAALSGEAAPDEPIASLKAMAISMRTFALANANRHQSEGFGLCDSTHCQALRLGKPRPEVEQAVRETAGETLWSGGQRAHVFYTQHCGGMSEAASAVWPEEKAAYLAGPAQRSLLPASIPCAMANSHSVASTGRNLPRPGLAHSFSHHGYPDRPARCCRPRPTSPDNRARCPGAALRQQLSLRRRPCPRLEPDA